MSAPRERRPSRAQLPILEALVYAGGGPVRGDELDVYAPVGSWLAVKSAGWVDVDMGPTGHAAPRDQVYTLTVAGWRVAGVACQFPTCGLRPAALVRDIPPAGRTPICRQCDDELERILAGGAS